MKNILCIFACLTVLSSFAQEPLGDLRLGQWKSHLPYTRGFSVTQSAETVFFATDQSVFSVDKEEHSIQLYNKISGLSDAGIRKIKYYTDPDNPENDALVIAYQNSNIDLLRSNGVVNLNDIKRKSITGDKAINHIFLEGQYAWFSCGFGIVKLDLINEEFLQTTFTSFPVNAINIYDGQIYASTENAIYTVANDETLNLTDFGLWQRLSTDVGLPSNYSSQVSAVFKGKLYAGVDNALYSFDGTDWVPFFEDPLFNIINIFVGKSVMVADTESSGRDRIILLPENGVPFVIYNDAITGKNPETIQDEEGNFWIADVFQGFHYFVIGQSVKKFEVEGPERINVGNLTVHNGELWMASANLEPKWNFTSNNNGFSSYIDGDWTNYNNSRPDLNGLIDMNTITVHPETGTVFVGAFNKGLVEYDRENFTRYDPSNSTLKTSTADPNNYRVSGLALDVDNNLWVSNYLSQSPINVFTSDRQWAAFVPDFPLYLLTDVIVDDSGYKWFATNGSGILIYDSGADILSSSDDRYATLNTSNSALETNEILSLQKDLDGFIWVGTDEGVFLFDCPGQVFDNSCPGRRPIAQEGGINDLLLATESVNAIAVDGANRKWFGTNNGLFVLETDANEATYIFNTENSPLFDNSITALAIDGKTGEVYIGTEKGLISYRANATDGANFFKKDEVFAFPNPVRPDYEGEIAIKGLVTDADIKITDVGGSLIYETTALGGQAVWNGKDYNGNRARTGVYLVFATSRDGTEKIVTKVLFIN